MSDEENEFPITREPSGRKPTLPMALGGGDIEQVVEFNPMLELFSVGDGRFGVDSRTDLTSIEIVQISRGRFISDFFTRGLMNSEALEAITTGKVVEPENGSLELLNQWIDSILRLKISHKRQSRMEAVEALKALAGRHEDATGITGILERLRR